MYQAESLDCPHSASTYCIPMKFTEMFQWVIEHLYMKFQANLKFVVNYGIFLKNFHCSIVLHSPMIL